MYGRHGSHGLKGRAWVALSLLLASTAPMLGGAAESYAADRALSCYSVAGDAVGHVASEGIGVGLGGDNGARVEEGELHDNDEEGEE